jgi:hypothetical protein
MTKIIKFQKSLPRKKKKRHKQPHPILKRNIRLHPPKSNNPNNFKINEEEIDKTFSLFELADDHKFTFFSGDDPSEIPSQINIGINEPFFENEIIP